MYEVKREFKYKWREHDIVVEVQLAQDLEINGNEIKPNPAFIYFLLYSKTDKDEEYSGFYERYPIQCAEDIERRTNEIRSDLEMMFRTSPLLYKDSNNTILKMMSRRLI